MLLIATDSVFNSYLSFSFDKDCVIFDNFVLMIFYCFNTLDDMFGATSQPQTKAKGRSAKSVGFGYYK